jgi:ABC-type Mn2+/Zn2+ transport system permease subunit
MRGNWIVANCNNLVSFSEKQNQIYSESRLGAVYAIGLAASILILAKCPVAEQGWMNLLKGEIIAVSDSDLWVTILGLG